MNLPQIAPVQNLSDNSVQSINKALIDLQSQVNQSAIAPTNNTNAQASAISAQASAISAQASAISAQASLLGLGGIVASGSNSNGSYIQFADGTMQCWFIFSSVAAGSGWSWTFPVTFVGNGATVTSNGSTHANFSAFASLNETIFLTSVGGYYDSTINSGNGALWLKAIGRWT